MNNEFQKLINLLNSFTSISTKNAERLAVELMENKFELEFNLDKIVFLLKQMEKCKNCSIYKKVNSQCGNCEQTTNELYIYENTIDFYNLKTKISTEQKSIILDINSKKDYSNLSLIKKSTEKLIEYIKNNKIEKIMFIFSPTIESDILIKVLRNEIKISSLNIKYISKLSIGLPFGSSIKYIDEKTLKGAMKNSEKI